jgi:hypothetical protein
MVDGKDRTTALKQISDVQRSTSWCHPDKGNKPDKADSEYSKHQGYGASKSSDQDQRNISWSQILRRGTKSYKDTASRSEAQQSAQISNLESDFSKGKNQYTEFGPKETNYHRKPNGQTCTYNFSRESKQAHNANAYSKYEGYGAAQTSNLESDYKGNGATNGASDENSTTSENMMKVIQSLMNENRALRMQLQNAKHKQMITEDKLAVFKEKHKSHEAFRQNTQAKSKPCWFFANNQCKFGLNCWNKHKLITQEPMTKHSKTSSKKLKRSTDLEAKESSPEESSETEQSHEDYSKSESSTDTKVENSKQSLENNFIKEKIKQEAKKAITKYKQEQNIANPLMKSSKSSFEKLKSANDTAARKEKQTTENQEISAQKHKWILEDKCLICGKDSSLKCSQCKLVYYCNKKHQIEDWRNHKFVCRTLSPNGVQTVKEDDRSTE